MAQKALKQLAGRNRDLLNKTHSTSLAINLFFLLVRWLLFQRRLLPYLLCAAPALAVEIWFERIGRPTWTSTDNDSGAAELRGAGEDLEAKGLTEWMWDVIYWTWGVTVLAALAGDWAWWAWLAVPAYSGYLAWTTFTGARQGLAGMGGGAEESTGRGTGAQSKRQAKMEKRGGQRAQFR